MPLSSHVDNAARPLLTFFYSTFIGRLTQKLRLYHSSDTFKSTLSTLVPLSDILESLLTLSSQLPTTIIKLFFLIATAMALSVCLFCSPMHRSPAIDFTTRQQSFHTKPLTVNTISTCQPTLSTTHRNRCANLATHTAAGWLRMFGHVIAALSQRSTRPPRQPNLTTKLIAGPLMALGMPERVEPSIILLKR